MNGSPPVRISVTSSKWVQQDVFLTKKVQEYEQRLLVLNRLLEDCPRLKAELYQKLDELITAECNRNSVPIDVMHLTNYQCRLILQELHSKVTPITKAILNEAPFKTVNNPFYNIRAKGKTAVLYNYLREQENFDRPKQEKSHTVEQNLMYSGAGRGESPHFGGEDGHSFAAQNPVDVSSRPAELVATAPFKAYTVSHTEKPVTLIMPVTSAPPVTSVTVARDLAPADGPGRRAKNIARAEPERQRNTTVPINSTPRPSDDAVTFVEAGQKDGWLSRDLANQVVSDTNSVEVIRRLRYLTSNKVVQSLSEYQELSQNVRGLLTDRTVSSQLRLLSLEYLRYFVKTNNEPRFETWVSWVQSVLQSVNITPSRVSIPSEVPVLPRAPLPQNSPVDNIPVGMQTMAASWRE